jgi:hypothetical protein
MPEEFVSHLKAAEKSQSRVSEHKIGGNRLESRYCPNTGMIPLVQATIEEIKMPATGSRVVMAGGCGGMTLA